MRKCIKITLTNLSAWVHTAMGSIEKTLVCSHTPPCSAAAITTSKHLFGLRVLLGLTLEAFIRSHTERGWLHLQR